MAGFVDEPCLGIVCSDCSKGLEIGGHEPEAPDGSGGASDGDRRTRGRRHLEIGRQLEVRTEVAVHLIECRDTEAAESGGRHARHPHRSHADEEDPIMGTHDLPVGGQAEIGLDVAPTLERVGERGH